MKSMRRHLVVLSVTLVSALTVLGMLAVTALATVSGGLVDGQGQNVGRGGVFTVTTLSGWSALEVLGGLAISAAAVALVVWVGVRSDNRARRSLVLVPGGTSTGEPPEQAADQERKAA